MFFIFLLEYMKIDTIFNRIRTSQFQLLGAACLFLASKFKAVDHLSSEMMVSYTDYSITQAELKVSNYHSIHFYEGIILL